MRISDWSSDVCSSDLTLREWGVRLDEALFLGGRAKGPCLDVFGADIFFDDSLHNIDSARQHVAPGNVPHGVRSAERRVGKACVSTCKSRWSRYLKKNNINSSRSRHTNADKYNE